MYSILYRIRIRFISFDILDKFPNQQVSWHKIRLRHAYLVFVLKLVRNKTATLLFIAR